MKILHVSPFGSGFNIGNFAITRGIHRWIDEIYPGATIINIPATGEKSYLVGLTKSSIHFANQYCDAVLVGGGNLIENNEINLDLNALSSLQVPLSLFSVSSGRIFNRHGLLTRRTDTMPVSVLSSLLRSCKQVFSRDIATQDIFHSLSPENTALGACPTLFLENKTCETLSSFPEEKATYLSIRNPEQMNIPVFQKRELYDLIHDLLVFMKSKFEKVLLLCHDLRDIPFATSFSDNVDFYYTPNVDDYLLTIQNAELVVSFRVHASLPSYALGTDFINISYDERGLSLMETIGLKEWDVNLMDGHVLDAVKERVLSEKKPNITDSKVVQGFHQKQKQFIMDIL